MDYQYPSNLDDIGNTTWVSTLSAEYSAPNIDNNTSVYRKTFQIHWKGSRKIIKIVLDLANDDGIEELTLYMSAKSAFHFFNINCHKSKYETF